MTNTEILSFYFDKTFADMRSYQRIINDFELQGRSQDITLLDTTIKNQIEKIRIQQSKLCEISKQAKYFLLNNERYQLYKYLKSLKD